MGLEDLGPTHVTPEVEEICDEKDLRELTKLRHPDPSLTHKLKIQFPELQVLGSWKKLTLLKKGGMKARLAFSSFIWNSKCDVAITGVRLLVDFLKVSSMSEGELMKRKARGSAIYGALISRNSTNGVSYHHIQSVSGIRGSGSSGDFLFTTIGRTS
jgi:hypothetical protein